MLLMFKWRLNQLKSNLSDDDLASILYAEERELTVVFVEDILSSIAFLDVDELLVDHFDLE